MKQQSQDLRRQTLEYVLAGAGKTADAQVKALITAWLNALEPEDLAGLDADSLASPLWEGFSRLARWTPRQACRIEPLSCIDRHGARSTAILILNQDMPFLVDSMVMAMRKLRIPSRAVLNAVLSVQRTADGDIVRVDKASDGNDAHESYVLCLMSDQLQDADLTGLLACIRIAAGDAATVHRDAQALHARMDEVGETAATHDADGEEVKAFLEWAGNGGFEVFGYEP